MSIAQIISLERARRLGIGFLCAGSSALLLAIAQTYDAFWLVSFVALIPFLWLTARTNNYFGAIGAGAVLGLCFGLVTIGNQLLLAPGAVFLRVALLSLVFGLFGFMVCWAKRKVGFNPILIAALWVPLEYILVRGGTAEGISTILPAGSIPTQDLLLLIGLLAGSFVIVLANAVILELLRFIYNRLRSGRSVSQPARTSAVRRLSVPMLSRQWFLFADDLSPPPVSDF